MCENTIPQTPNSNSESKEKVETFDSLSQEKKLLSLIATRDHLRELSDNYNCFADPEAETEIEVRGYLPSELFGRGNEMNFGKEPEAEIEKVNAPFVSELYRKQKQAANDFFLAIASSSTEAAEKVQAEIDSLLK